MGMRTSLVTVLLALVVAAVAIGSALGSASKPPKLRVLDRAPLRLAGTGFRKQERIRLTVSAGATWRKTIRASSTGGFSTSFADVAVDRCMGVVAIARGATGDMASAKVMPMACPPALRQP